MTALSDAFVEVAAITRRYRDPSVTSSVAEHNAILAQLKMEGSIKSDVSGGTEILCPVTLVENATIQNYAGWDVQNIGQSDSIRPARFPWAQKSIHVSANGQELRMNSSKEAMANLVEVRQQVAEETAANRMAIELYGDATAYEAINGLGNFLPTGGMGTVGGLNAATYPNWRSKFLDAPANPSSTNVEADFATLYKTCVIQNDKPNLIMASHDIYTLLEAAIINKSRYFNGGGGGGYMAGSKAHSNFESIIWKKNVDVVFDSNTNFSTTGETAYFLNTRHLQLKEHPQAKWDFEEARKPINADGVVIPAYWMGQLIIKKRRTMGRYFDT